MKDKVEAIASLKRVIAPLPPLRWNIGQDKNLYLS
jgi:hypothetical protein